MLRQKLSCLESWKWFRNETMHIVDYFTDEYYVRIYLDWKRLMHVSGLKVLILRIVFILSVVVLERLDCFT